MRTLHVAALVAAVALIPASGLAQTGLTETITARSGQPAGLVVYFNCVNHLLPGAGEGSALHGTVKATRTTRSACGNPKEPAWEFVYTSNPGFKGDDLATIYFGGEVQSMKVVVQ